MEQQVFLQRWAEEHNAAPLALTGPSPALIDATSFIRSLFAPTDVYVVQPGDTSITIEQVREMRQHAVQSAWSGRRLIIISEAEKLSTTAAQALLKILEDPSRSSRFILTTQWYRRLLPTIRSRATQLRVRTEKTPSLPTTGKAIPASLLERLAKFSGDTPLTPEVLQEIASLLEHQLRAQGATPMLRAAYVRLKEYYRVAAFPGGNQKLARDVLLVSLPKTD